MFDHADKLTPVVNWIKSNLQVADEICVYVYSRWLIAEYLFKKHLFP